MRKLNLLPCAILLGAYFQTYSSAQIVVIPQNNTSNMHFIGTIEGKSFFADITKRTWAESKKFCEGHGMHLVSNETEKFQCHNKENGHENISEK